MIEQSLLHPVSSSTIAILGTWGTCILISKLYFHSCNQTIIMKQATLFLCTIICFTTARADKNNQAAPQKLPATQQQPQPPAPTQSADYGERMYDPRLARHGYVAPDSADIVKYNLKRPSMPDKTDKKTSE